ncbi:MAG: LPS-assembly protein LptD [Candidatus Glassbacteria bacterium]|nr:LPS-assembly protein LptD [Candidatus Glassbacteria bacterium]
MQALIEKGMGRVSSVRYAGNRIVFFMQRNVMVLQGQADVSSQQQEVASDSLIAYNRSTGDIFVSGKTRLSDGTDELEGGRVRYNLDHNHGVISEGSTQFAEWELHSSRMAKVGADSVFGRGNVFSSCDLEQSKHFHFESRRIKVIRDKRVFASPVVLKVGKVPVFALPFVFFPVTRGNRKSGILQPRIGVNSIAYDRITGRTFGNLGYFWAPSDYVDFLGAVDIRTSSQTTFRGRTRYRKRYSYDGNFDIRRINDKINNSTDFSIFGRHNQTLSESSRFNAEVNYTSSRDLLQRTGFDQQDLLRQSVRSTASYYWRPSWGSFTTSARHEKFLSSDRTVTNLPSASLSLNKRGLFPYMSRTVPRRHGLVSSGWLYNITWGASTSYSHNRTTESNDSTRSVHNSNSRFELDSPQTLYGWLKVNPSLRYSTRLSHDNFRADGERFDHEQTLNFSSSMSTQIYGFFDGPRLGPIYRWRHTIRPTLTYNFQPDLTELRTRGKVSRLSLSISNDIDYKYFTDTDSRTDSAAANDDERPSRNGQLVRVRNSLNYDFTRAAKRDTLGWGNLSTSITSSPTSFLNVQLLMNHDLVEPGQRERFDPFMRSLSTTITLRGTYKGEGRQQSPAELEEEAYRESMRYPGTAGSAFNPRMSDYETQRDLAFSRAMPWSVNISHNLSRSRSAARNNQSIRWSFTFNPTAKWHLVYSSSFNFNARGLQGQRFILNRDLHCWRANLSLITLTNGRFEFVFSTYLLANPAIRVPDVRRASN